MMLRMAAISYQFLMELTICMLVISLVLINNKEQLSVFPIFSLGLAGILLFTLLLEKFQQKGKWLYIISVFPVILIGMKLTGLSFFSGCVLGLFIFWRGTASYENPLGKSETTVLLWTFIIGLIAIIYSAASQYPYQIHLILLFIFQVFLVLAGSFFTKWASLGMDKTKFAVFFLKFFTALAMVGATAALLLNYLRVAFFGIMELLALLFSAISVPIFSLMQFMMRFFGGEGSISNIKENAMQELTGEYQDKSYETTEYIFYLLVVFAVVVFIFYFIKRKLHTTSIASPSSTAFEISEIVFGTDDPGVFRRKAMPPENKIRREIFNFERLAHKLKLERIAHESLEEWWVRIGLTATDDIIERYEKVRYGDMTVSSEDLAYFKKEMNELKQKLKNIHKDKKENSE